jgi:hypothetical protein
MIVYRFEKNGIGPYVSGTRMMVGSFYCNEAKTRTQKKYANAFTQKVSQIDPEKRMSRWGKAHSDRKYLYGCSSKEMLRTYFRGNFKPLFKHGYRIKRYKVPDEEVIDMGIEVAFPVKYHKLQTMKALNKRTTI